MKLSVRLITLVLAIVMLASMAIACAQNTDDNPADTTTAAVADNNPATPDGGDATETTVDNTVDVNGFLLDELPDELNYNNAEVFVLHWEAERDEFQSEGITGDNILDNIYQRNLNIEERLGVKLGFEESPGNNKNLSAFVKKVENSYQAGEKVYDIVAT